MVKSASSSPLVCKLFGPSDPEKLMLVGFGVLLIISSVSLFGLVAQDIVTSDRLTLMDEQIAQWLHLRASVDLTRWMWLISLLHSTTAMIFYTGVIAIVAIRKRQWRGLATLALCVVGGMLLNVLMKLVFHRDRPHFTDQILTLTSYSFPSGHVAAATIFYGLGVVWVFLHTRLLRWRVLAVALAALAILLVAFSRMLLGVHYLSDVIAAFAEGSAWLALCLLAMAAFWRKASISPDPVLSYRSPAPP